MSYPGRHGQHYQNQNGGGGPPQQMPAPMYNQGPPQGYGPPPGQYGQQYQQPQGPPPGQYGQPPLQWGQPGQMTQSNYQGQPINWQQPHGQTMNGNQRYEYSNMQGKRKALLIGINYIGCVCKVIVACGNLRLMN